MIKLFKLPRGNIQYSEQKVSSLTPNLQIKSEILCKHEQIDKKALQNGQQSTHTKEKIIRKKPSTIMEKLSRTLPSSFSHVFNFLGILGINEHTLRDIEHEQSYFKSMFYIKSVEKVELRKKAIVVITKNIDQQTIPMYTSSKQRSYLIDRYRSFGDIRFYELSNLIEKSYTLYSRCNSNNKNGLEFKGDTLSQFIESMKDKTYMCRISPNKIVISRKLIELIGEDFELYGLKICKYKTPISQIISAYSYLSVISRSIENIGLVSQFINGTINQEILHKQSYLQFQDYIYTNQHKKIFCKFAFHMPTPYVSCIEIIEQINHTDEQRASGMKKRLLNKECQKKRQEQAQILQHLTQMQDNQLRSNTKRLAGYHLKEDIEIVL